MGIILIIKGISFIEETPFELKKNSNYKYYFINSKLCTRCIISTVQQLQEFISLTTHMNLRYNSKDTLAKGGK